MNTTRPYFLFSTTDLARAARRTTSLLLAGAALAIATLDSRAASATPPDLMAYQGFLVDANGTPLAPTNPLNYPAIFRIYTASQDGTRLWSEQQIVTVDKGNFSVLLGQGTQYASELRPALSTVMGGADASDLYVGVTVTIDGSSQEILPRLRLMTSPYAFLATRAANLVQPNGTPVISYSGGQIQLSGGVNVSGTVSGNGSGLTGLTSAQIPTTLTGDRTFTGNIFMNNAASLWARNSVGALEPVFWPRFADNMTYLNFGTGGFNIRNNASSPVMFMQNGGNIGVGTTAPETRLQVGSYGSGDEYLTVATAGGNQYRAGIKLRHFSTGYGWTIEGDERDSSFGIYSHFADVAGVSRLRINRFSGNVGIGTTAPAAKLDVNGTLSVAGGGVFGNIMASIKPDATRYMPLSLRATDNTGFIDFSATASPGFTGMWMYYGNAWKPGGGSWGATSDARLKKNVAPMTGALEKLGKLRGVSFEWVDPKSQGNQAGRQGGFIAQEVEEVFPDWVTPIQLPDQNGQPSKGVPIKTISLPFEFDALVVESIKELNQERVNLRSENSELKRRIAELEAGKASVDTRLSALEGLLNGTPKLQPVR